MAIKIIEKGADLNIPSKTGDYPIHICIKNNYPDIVKLLISHDCNLNVQNKAGQYPLTLTNWETVDDKSLAKLLKKNGAKDLCFEKMCEDKKLQFEHQEAINEKRKQMLEQTSIELDKDYETIEKQKDEKMAEVSKLENDLKGAPACTFI
ncbi:hypothetical protein TVAG_251190 [Trichomonas vaginalis G3]|uniref:Uncharacterized protein n=1 Tax=Trichomonas vaginalis (strain ATCC PRA-98 / G3) TaxID=412133 RepID=A2FUY4_TRIV3|nr:spectrin binding [Trichomonas vaginalis G3]EAX91275.1 hypothetical protein TVAG_251190 [Trichomonas vaginalis G3]KAI5538443.1 spectrin binding [Trichomonas vaginalis G3]|eukprot:XP_001304205.1 hypothetical protein [Trichomonas vaginalis G3]